MVVLNFKRLNQTELAAFTNNVLYRTVNNEQFSSLKAQLTDLKTAYETFLTACANAANGGKDRVLEKNTRMTDLMTQLTIVARNVELLAGDQDDVVMASGFDVRKERKTTQEVTVPAGLIVQNAERSGAVNLSWESVTGAVTYAVETLVKGETAWQNGKYCTTKTLTLENFTPGTYVEFHVKTIGRGTLSSDWTPSIGVWVS